MLMRRAIGLLIFPCLAVLSAPLRGQTVAEVRVPVTSTSSAGRLLGDDRTVVATYDELTDSTHLAVVTHKGKYFLTIQRPRLTWILSYPGRTAPDHPPADVMLVFRTQSPQAARDSRLAIEFGAGQRLEFASIGAYSDPGVMTWSHFMHFPVSTEALAEALATDDVTMWVGGIEVRFKADQLNALRDLLSRAGAWPWKARQECADAAW